MITCTDKNRTFEFMAQKLGMQWSNDFRGAMFVPEQFRHLPPDPQHVAVAIAWTGFVGRTCQLSAVIQQPQHLTKAIVREAFRFPFEVCNLLVVIALVDSLNHKSNEICRRLGFEAIARIPNGGLEGDLIVYQMLRQNCRWLRKVH